MYVCVCVCVYVWKLTFSREYIIYFILFMAFIFEQLNGYTIVLLLYFIQYTFYNMNLFSVSYSTILLLHENFGSKIIFLVCSRFYTILDFIKSTSIICYDTQSKNILLYIYIFFFFISVVFFLHKIMDWHYSSWAVFVVVFIWLLVKAERRTPAENFNIIKYNY